MKKKLLGIGLAATGFFIIALLIAGAAMGGNGGLADDRIADYGVREIEGGSGGLLAASPMSPSINYQGRLKDSAGNPLNGTYNMTFTLYENTTGGTGLSIDTHQVTVTDGLFSTNISFNWGFFDGRALWLGIKVGTDPEMTPRQSLQPVPYTLSLRPGARIYADISDPVIWVENLHDNGQGVYAKSYGYRGYGLWANAFGDESCGVYSLAGGDESCGVYAISYGDDSDGVYAKNEGNNSYGVRGIALGDYSVGVRAHTTGVNSMGVHATTEGDYGSGVYAYTTGYNAIGGVFKTENYSSPGIWAETIGDNSDGINAYTYGDLSDGIYAHATGYNAMGALFKAEGDNSCGVWAKAFGNYSDGVYAISEKAHGVHGISNLPTDGVGVKGEGAYGVVGDGTHVGVYGQGNEAGGYFTTTMAGSWWHKKPVVKVSAPYDYNPGVFITTTGHYSEGIYTETDGYYSQGVLAVTTGNDSVGFYAHTDGKDSNGVSAYTSGNSSTGVYAYTTGNDSVAVFGVSDKYYGGIFNGAGDLGIYVHGNIYKSGTVSFVEDYPTDPTKEIVYVCLEGGETGTYTRGSGQLIDGEAVVQLPEHFSMVTSSEGLTVQVTPASECKGLYIVSKSPTELVVKELNGGTSDATFDYLVNGVRKGYEEFQPIRDKEDMPELGELAWAPEQLGVEEYRFPPESPTAAVVLSETD